MILLVVDILALTFCPFQQVAGRQVIKKLLISQILPQPTSELFYNYIRRQTDITYACVYAGYIQRLDAATVDWVTSIQLGEMSLNCMR